MENVFFFSQVGTRSSLKSSQSITDLFHVPEKDSWHTPNRQQGISYEHNLKHRQLLTYPVNLNQCNNPSKNNPYMSYSTYVSDSQVQNSLSVPNNLQLCGCYLKDIAINTNYSYMLNPKINYFEPKINERPRRLKIEKSKFKLHKSLPVSPVSEECRFSDFAQPEQEPRKSFSYFIDLENQSTEEGLRQVCSDIEKFSQEHNYDIYDVKKEDDDEEANFSSDSLEDCSFNSIRNIKKKYSMPRRCYSNNEIYNHDNFDDSLIIVDQIPKSKTSFYLNQSNRNSQDSILSDDYNDYRTKSYCNSLESVLSDESECRSAPLEVLFAPHRHKKPVSAQGSPYHQPSTSRATESELHSGSLPNEYFDKNYISYFTTSPKRSIPLVTPINTEKIDLSRSKSLGNDMKENIENIENQNPVTRIKKSNTSYDFQQKLLKFETGAINEDNKPLRENTKKSIAYFIETPIEEKKKSVAYFVENAKKKFEKTNMDIPSLKTKNIQYKSRYCNVLNNKPEIKPETLFKDGPAISISQNNPVIFLKETKKSNTLESTKHNNGNMERHLETTSLDRHLLSKSLWDAEKVVHKPPKAVRRNSSKTYNRNRSKKLQNNLVSDKNLKTPVNFDRNVVKKDNSSDSDIQDSIENVIEVNYKEKNKEIDCESSSKTILADIYDSLDKLIIDTKIEQDSLENINEKLPDDFWGKSKSVLEAEQKNVWKKYDDFDKINTEKSQNTTKLLNLSPSDLDKIQHSIENIKLLHEIQQKIHKINLLVDTFKENITKGKVKVLSKMYETLSRSQIGLNNITDFSAPIRKKRNLSVPNFVERNLSVIANTEKQDNLKTSNELSYKRPPDIESIDTKKIEKKKYRGFEILPSKIEGEEMLSNKHEISMDYFFSFFFI